MSGDLVLEYSVLERVRRQMQQIVHVLLHYRSGVLTPARFQIFYEAISILYLYLHVLLVRAPPVKC